MASANSNIPLDGQAALQNVQAPNPAALAGAAICGGSAIFYGVLFYTVSGLAGAQPELSQLADKTPALLRIMLLGSSAVFLNIIALGLGALGLVLPGRRRTLAWIVVFLSAVLLLGLAGVVLLSMIAG